MQNDEDEYALYNRGGDSVDFLRTNAADIEGSPCRRDGS